MGTISVAAGTTFMPQHINGSGTQLWAQDGVPVCATGGVQQNPKIVRDENVRRDYRVGGHPERG
jgi:hypothetical protein